MSPQLRRKFPWEQGFEQQNGQMPPMPEPEGQQSAPPQMPPPQMPEQGPPPIANFASQGAPPPMPEMPVETASTIPQRPPAMPDQQQAPPPMPDAIGRDSMFRRGLMSAREQQDQGQTGQPSPNTDAYNRQLAQYDQAKKGVPAWRDVLGAALSFSPRTAGIGKALTTNHALEDIQKTLPTYKAGADEERLQRQEADNARLREEQIAGNKEWRLAAVDQRAAAAKPAVTIADKVAQARAVMGADGKPLYSEDQLRYIGGGWTPPAEKAAPLHNVPRGDVALGPDNLPVFTNPANDKPASRDDRAIELLSKPPGSLTTEEKAYLGGFDKWVDKTKTQPGVMRVETLGQTREMAVLDTKNQNSPMYLSASDINRANQREPGRYIPAGTSAPALTKTALLEDIRGNVQQVRGSLAAMPDFNGMDKAKIAVALRSRDPKGAISALISGGAAGALTPQQQDYLINTTNLIENAMAMRSVLGAGQGSEDLRSAIMATVPGPTTPNKAYALQQLAAFEKVLGRLERGVPKVPLRSDVGGGGEASGTIGYQVGSDHYDIPVAKEAAFLKAHPGAVQR